MMKRLGFGAVFFISSLAAQENLSLSKAYELALSYSPKHQTQRYKTDASAQGIEQAKSRLYPKIDLTGSGGQFEYETYYNDKTTSEVYKTYSLSLVQPLFRAELFDVIEQAEVKYHASKEELSQEEQQLGVDVAKAYVKILQVNVEIEKLATQKTYYETKYQKLAMMLPLGLSNTVEILEAKASKDKAMVDYTSKKRDLLAVQSKLHHLIGVSFTLKDAPNIQYIPELFSMTKSLWKKQLLDKNREFKMATLSKEAARLEMDIRQAEHYPKVDLILGNTHNDTKDPVAHKYDNKAFIQVSVPLYQGGYTKSRVEEATLLFHAASSSLDAVKLQILDQFEELWTQRESILETIAVLKEAKESAHMYRLAIEKSLKEGTKSQVDLLEAKTKYEAMKSEYASAYYEMLLNEISLYALTGNLTLSKLYELEVKVFGYF